MSAFVVRYEMRPETAQENQRLVQDVLAELAETAPAGFGYAAFRLSDGVGFVHVGVSDGTGNPLAELPAFQRFQSGFADRAAAGPIPSQAELIGAYGLGATDTPITTPSGA